MSRYNGSKIGVVNTVTTGAASGVWSSKEQFQNSTSWPIAIKPTPVFYGSYIGYSSSASSYTISYTIPAYGVAVLCAGRENPSGPISSISSNGGTWYARIDGGVETIGYSNVVFSYQQLSNWYSINNTASAITTSATIYYSTNYDSAAGIIATFTGCNMNSPWLSDASRSFSVGNPNTSPSGSITTSVVNSLGILSTGNAQQNVFDFSAYGWTLINRSNSRGASYFSYVSMWYKAFPSVVTSQSFLGTGSSTNSGWVTMTDSLVW